VLLAPNVHQVPEEYDGLKDIETRDRKWYLDMIINDDVRQIFITRAKVINFVRRYLDNLGFLEVRHEEISSCLF
jgi:lysyl-tRNA synthetase class 2